MKNKTNQLLKQPNLFQFKSNQNVDGAMILTLDTMQK